MLVNTCRALLKQVGPLNGSVVCTRVSATTAEMSPLCAVNATRGEEQRLEEFPPNVTSFSIRRLDRYTRYRFSVAARTAVGLGEWHTEESPHYTTESNGRKKTHFGSSLGQRCSDVRTNLQVSLCVSLCSGPGGHLHSGLVDRHHVRRGPHCSHPADSVLHQEEPRREVPR